MSGGSGSKGRSKQRVRTDIPDFLRPFVDQVVGTSSGALRNLSAAGSGDVVADLNADQLAALDSARNVAGGAGGFIPTAQNELLRTSRGVDVESALPESVRTTLGSILQNDSILPPQLESIFNESRITGDVIGDSSRRTLENLQSGGVSVSPEARGTLESTARGDFLFGGEGFNQAVDAAVRAARPGIISTFGRGGAGAATGGLAQTAIAQSGIDAFARQFGQERQRQLSAADRLAGLDLAEGAQNASTRAGAARSLAGLDLSEQQLRTNAGLSGAGLLADFFGGEESRALSGAGLLAGLSDRERDRQLNAVNQLPGAGLLDSNLLRQVGDTLQAQDQREISGPIDFNAQLLQAALSGLPLQSLLGRTGNTKNNGLSLGFG